MDIIDNAQLRNVSVAFLFLNAKKAFDQIEWKYLFYILKKIGVGDNFVAWLCLLYSERLAFILIERQMLEKIKIFHGVG